MHSVFDEEQIFRIDHYLGREAVQNLLAMRFANGMFEPVWNRNHIDHVQIDVPETLSIGMRAGFYEETGAFRDMVVTHLFQVLSFVAMEPPTSLEREGADGGAPEGLRLDAAARPGDVVRGQYDGYREEEGVAADSDTETFVALRAFVDNWRWEGVPFYLRSGKRLAQSRHVLTVAFTQPPRRMFPIDCSQVAESFGCDHLTFELGDPGSISATFLAKVPGPTMQLGQAHMRFSYADRLRRPRAGARRLRAPDPRRHGRRPHVLHHLRSDRAPLGGRRARPARPPPVAVLRARLLGPGGDRRADRAAPLAPAERPRLSSDERLAQLAALGSCQGLFIVRRRFCERLKR